MNRRTAILLILGLLLQWAAHAQYTSRLGRFQVNEVKGCAPLTVNITINAPFVCDGANPCDMDFEGNDNFQSLTFTHTYSQPGSYLLRILFQTSGFDDIAIEVAPDEQPQFELYTCANNEVSVKLNDSNYDEYIINYQDGSPEVTVGGTASNDHVYASAGMQTVTVRGHNINSADNCTPAGTIITPLLTLPTPTITLLEVLDDQSIRLEFNAQSNIQYRLDGSTGISLPGFA